ncbi:MAG: hypothetical protein R2788_01560 [Saprospiraceae bacterium]
MESCTNVVNGNCDIINNSSLTSLDGLETLTAVDGRLKIWGEDVLTDILAIESLVTVNGDFEFWNIDAVDSSVCSQKPKCDKWRFFYSI